MVGEQAVPYLRGHVKLRVLRPSRVKFGTDFGCHCNPSLAWPRYCSRGSDMGNEKLDALSETVRDFADARELGLEELTEFVEMLADALGKRKMKASAESIAAGLEEAGVEVWGDLSV